MNIKKILAASLGLGIFLGAWSYASSLYPEVILPSISDMFRRLFEILLENESLEHIQISILRIFVSFFSVLFFGFLIGVLAGIFSFVRYFMQPLEYLMISVPPIAWIVLALIWFGGDGLLSPVLTVFISCFPIIYLQTVQGVRTIDKKLLDMAKTFKMPYFKSIFYIGGLHILSFTYPSIMLIFGQSFKITVMAEVLGASTGIGSQIANARVNLETTDVFSWIAISVVLYIAIGLILKPIDMYIMRWRS